MILSERQEIPYFTSQKKYNPMKQNSYSFEMKGQASSIIKVMGIGGGGSNAVNSMFRQGIKDVDFVVCNTDIQALKSSPIPWKIQVGANLTQGLGAGGDPEKGKNAVIESQDEIQELLSEGTRMLFVTAGMGGGTGTGGAPIVAGIAKKLGILTVGIVTEPFSFEGKKKKERAEEGLRLLKENCDTVLVVSNDKIKETFAKSSIRNAFEQADQVLTIAAKGIAEIITTEGYVNVDFEDVKTVLKDSGTAMMGSCEVSGENRAIRAVEGALDSPLLRNRKFKGARKILIYMSTSSENELQLWEHMEILGYTRESSDPNAELTHGFCIDETLDDKLRLTVVAAGYDEEAEVKENEDGLEIDDLPLFLGKTRKDATLENKPRKGWGIVSGQEAGEQEVFDKPLNIKSKSRLRLGEHPDLGVKIPLRVSLEKYEDSIPESEEELPNPPRESRGVEGKGPPPEEPATQTWEEDILDQGKSLEDPFDVDIPGQIEDEEQLIPEELLSGYKTLLDQQRTARESDASQFTRFCEMNQEDLEMREKSPAYMRRKVNLVKVPSLDEKKISRYKLTEDDSLTGDNRFLHDNPD